MATSASDVLTTLKNGEYAPVYFLQGEEPFHIDQISSYIEKNALEEAQKSFNQIILYGREVSVNDVLQNAKRFPMMSDRQVVIVKEAQEIQDLKKESGRTLLESYIKNPQPSTVLVFCHKYKKLDGRTSLGAVVKKQTVFVETKKLYENQVPQWVQSHTGELGLSISQDACMLITLHLGNNLERISNELEKIASNLKGEKEINLNHIQKYVGINRDYNVFELTKALMIKDVVKALKIVNYFEANLKNNPVIPVIAMIYTTFSKLLMFHGSSDKSDRGLVQVLKINPYFINEYKIGANNYPLPKVVENIRLIHQADIYSKGIGRPAIGDGQILKDLTYRLMH